jgi:hypothetical protein
MTHACLGMIALPGRSTGRCRLRLSEGIRQWRLDPGLDTAQMNRSNTLIHGSQRASSESSLCVGADAGPGADHCDSELDTGPGCDG